MASEFRTICRKTLRLSSSLDKPWICRSCSSKRFPLLDKSPASRGQLGRQLPTPRFFSTTSVRSVPDPEPPHSAPLPTSKIENLPSKQESQRSHLSKRFDTLMDNLQSNIFVAGQRINDLTGYSSIEALKKAIELQESSLETRRTTLQDAKKAYTEAINTRSASQREVNELLQRKNSWSHTDVERFTSLYRSDHENELREAQAAQAVADAERASEEASTKLASSILARYHEEQIWSDKIRRMSTWGTWGLMGVNVLLFLIFQVAVEPWRRRRLVAGFESKVVEALEKEGALTREGLSVAAGEITSRQNVSVPVVAVESAQKKEGGAEQMEVEKEIEAVVNDEIDSELKVYQVAEQPVEKPFSFTFNGEIDWRQYLHVARRQIANYFSEKTILVRQVDLTAATLEGMFIGVVVSGVIASLIRGR